MLRCPGDEGRAVSPDSCDAIRVGRGHRCLARATVPVRAPLEEPLMTDTGSVRPAVDTTRVAYSTAPGPTAWTGWVVFAAFMMIMIGFIQVIEGLMARINAVVALLFIEAAPVWGIILITVDVLVSYALTVHGRELRDAPM